MRDSTIVTNTSRNECVLSDQTHPLRNRAAPATQSCPSVADRPVSSLLKISPPRLSGWLAGFCTTRIQRIRVVQNPASHWGKPSGDIFNTLLAVFVFRDANHRGIVTKKDVADLRGKRLISVSNCACGK